MANTNKGIDYPTSSSAIAPLETHFANLANGADNVGVLSATQSFTGPAYSGTVAYVTVAVSYGETLGRVPTISCTVENVSTVPYLVNIRDITTTGFNARVYRFTETGSAEASLKLHWMASDYE